MSAYPPPLAFLSIYNAAEYAYGSSSLTTTKADARYLQLTGGTEAGLVTFNAGLNSIGPISVTSSTQSTTATTGALIVTGGLGLGKDLFTTGNINLLGNGTSFHSRDGSAANPSISFYLEQTTGLYRIGAGNIGWACSGVAYMDLNTTRLNLTSAINLIANNTTATTSSSTGAIQTAGGIASTNTTDATSSTNGGSLTLAGGAAVAKKMYIGTTLTVGTMGYLHYTQTTSQTISAGTTTVVNFSNSIANTFGSNLTVATSGAGKSFTNASGKTQTWAISYTIRWAASTQSINSFIKWSGSGGQYAQSLINTVSNGDCSMNGSIILQVANTQNITIVVYCTAGGTISADGTALISAVTIQQLVDSN